MKVIKIDLRNKKQREFYNFHMREFEKDFTYPLGETSFQICHGEDYFRFFETLGEVSYFVVWDKKIVGAVCAVLRDMHGIKAWYLCDFKIDKDYRGKKLYRKIMLKYFLSHYIKCPRFFFVNMSSPTDNRIFLHTQSIFKNLDIESRYLSTFSYSDINKLNADYSLVCHRGIKDIVIEGRVMPLYHLVLDTKKNLDKIPDNAKIMLLSHQRLGLFEDEIEISFIHKGIKGAYIWSHEI